MLTILLMLNILSKQIVKSINYQHGSWLSWTFPPYITIFPRENCSM